MTTRVKIPHTITGLLAQQFPVTTLLTSGNRIGKITVLFNHFSTYCIQLGELTGVIRAC